MNNAFLKYFKELIVCSLSPGGEKDVQQRWADALYELVNKNNPDCMSYHPIPLLLS
jgi:hypothetical protein